MNNKVVQFMDLVEEIIEPELLITHFCDTKAKVERLRDAFEYGLDQSKASMKTKEEILNSKDPDDQPNQEERNSSSPEAAKEAKRMSAQTASTAVSESLMRDLNDLTEQIVKIIKGDPAPTRTLFTTPSTSYAPTEPKMGGLTKKATDKRHGLEENH